MTSPTPKGAFSCGADAIATKLVACDWFPKFSKETDPIKQRARVYINKVPEILESTGEVIGFEDLRDLRPFACIWPAQPAGRFVGSIASGTVSVGLDYFIYIEAEDSDAFLDDANIDDTKEEELFAWWVNMVGVLLGGHPDDVAPIHGLIDQQNFALNNISAVDMMHTTRQEGMGTFFKALALLSTGAISA